MPHSWSSGTVAGTKITICFPESVKWQSSKDHALTPVFLASQDVIGSAEVQIHDVGSLPQNSGIVRVEFIGTYAALSWTTDPATGELSDIVYMAKDFDTSLGVSSQETGDTTSRSLFFNFVFQPCDRENAVVKFGPPKPGSQDTILESYTTTQFVCSRSIPSSAYARSDYMQLKKKSLEVSIQYKVHASLIRASAGGKILLAESHTDITVLDDSNQAQPPTWTADFGSEYALFRQAVCRSIKPRFLVEKLSKERCSLPLLFVEATEPNPLCFRRGTQYTTTKLPIAITSVRRGHDSVDGDSTCCSPNKVNLTWRLKKSTFCSLKALEKIPTLKQTFVDDKKIPVHLSVIRDRPRSYDCLLNQWKRDTTESLRSRHAPDKSSVFSLDENRNTRGDRTALDHSRGPLSAEKPSRAMTQDESSVTRPLGNDRNCTTNRSSHLSLLTTSNDKGKTPRLETTIPPNVPTLSTTVSLPIIIPSTDLPHPTSFSPYMCIRYSLQVYIRTSFGPSADTKCPDKEKKGGQNQLCGNSHYTACADLEVPVQIIYKGENEELSEFQEMDGLPFAREPEGREEEVLPSYTI